MRLPEAPGRDTGQYPGRGLGVVEHPRASGVTTKPGATALTLMPSAAYSAASDFVSWDTPPLLAL